MEAGEDKHTEEEPAEAKGDELQEEEEGDDQDSVSEYQEGKEPLLHTTKEVYTLIQVELGSVNNLRSDITKLVKANDSLAKEIKQQMSGIFEL